MHSLRDIAPYAALAGSALALLLLVAVIALWRSLRRLRRAQTVVLGHHEQRDIVAHVVSLNSQVRNMRAAVETLTGELEGHRALLDHTITNRAIVRYNAFHDAGGEQSASLALLDNYRSGVVFSTIAARDFARVYVKYLREGIPDRDLSPEEQDAVAAAVPRPLSDGHDGRRDTKTHLPSEDVVPPSERRLAEAALLALDDPTTAENSEPPSGAHGNVAPDLEPNPEDFR